MSAHKFTPGPWFYSDESGRVYFKDKNTGEEPPVCEMNVDDIMAIENQFEVDANANLIAAAPELFFHLEVAVNYFRKNKIDGQDLFLHEMESALAKARGDK